jgi:hypothetical protein
MRLRSRQVVSTASSAVNSFRRRAMLFRHVTLKRLPVRRHASPIDLPQLEHIESPPPVPIVVTRPALQSVFLSVSRHDGLEALIIFHHAPSSGDCSRPTSDEYG